MYHWAEYIIILEKLLSKNSIFFYSDLINKNINNILMSFLNSPIYLPATRFQIFLFIETYKTLSFSMVAATNYQKFSDLKWHKYIAL